MCQYVQANKIQLLKINELLRLIEKKYVSCPDGNLSVCRCMLSTVGLQSEFNTLRWVLERREFLI